MYFNKLTRFIINTTQKNVGALRRSGNYKRPQLKTKGDQLAEIRETYFKNQTELTSADWKTITDILISKYKHINKNNLDAVIVGICNDSEHLLLAKSYIKHLLDSGRQPNEATLGKLLKVYNAAYYARGGTSNALTNEEQEEILEICTKIRNKHEVLDSFSCENLIYGLIATEKWRCGLELLDMMKVTSNAPSLSAYTELTIKAFVENDLSLGWELLEQMLENRKQPKCEIFLTLIKTIKNKHFDNFIMELEKLFQLLEVHDIVITEKVVTALSDIAESHPNLMSLSRTHLKRFGQCKSCGVHMKNISVKYEDFKKLQESFLQKVLIRKDVFQKSTPEEVKQFCNYIDRTGPYDCVVDGLNVAYSMGSKKPVQALANLVRIRNILLLDYT